MRFSTRLFRHGCLALLVPAFVLTEIVLTQTDLAGAGSEGRNSALTPVPVDGFEARHQEKIRAASEHQFDLLLIGDSITHNLERPEYKAVWDQFYGSRNALDLGYGGGRIENTLWFLQNGELTNQSPKVAILLIGTNNADDRHFPTVHTPEQICEGTKAIVETIKQRCPTTKILILRIFPRGGDSEKGVGADIFHASAKCIETAPPSRRTHPATG